MHLYSKTKNAKNVLKVLSMMNQQIVVCLVLEVKFLTKRKRNAYALMKRDGGLVHSVSNVSCQSISMESNAKVVQKGRVII